MRWIVTLAMLMLSMVSFADKPEWAGKGKPTDEQKEAHRVAMEAKSDDRDDDLDEAREKSEKKMKKAKKDKKEKMAREDDDDDQDASDMAKQAGKKADQERKEVGKGSEKGQTRREENSKKWWKFWGE
jgi:hypothetical protein